MCYYKYGLFFGLALYKYYIFWASQLFKIPVILCLSKRPMSDYSTLLIEVQELEITFIFSTVDLITSHDVRTVHCFAWAFQHGL